MTEDARKAIDDIRKGNPIECSAEAYRSEIRDALVRLPNSADTPFLILQRQTVTSRAAVRIGRAPLFLWNQEFGGRREHGAHFAEAIGV